MPIQFYSIGGYPKYSTFGTVVGDRAPEGREEYLRYHSAAIAIPSPALSKIESISKEHNVFLILGVIEKDGGTLYCTVIFVDPITGYKGKHRKLVPTAMERIIWGRGDSSHLLVLEQNFYGDDVLLRETEQQRGNTKISAAICW